jgi:hypothetical protein
MFYSKDRAAQQHVLSRALSAHMQRPKEQNPSICGHYVSPSFTWALHREAGFGLNGSDQRVLGLAKYGVTKVHGSKAAHEENYA